MVDVAGSAGGQNSWSMRVTGKLDTTEIDNGFKRIRQGFGDIKGFAKGFGSDIVRVGNAVSDLAKKLGVLGIIGPSALLALASKAPAVAPALAKMQLALLKMSMSLGEALAPAFEKVAGWLDKLSAWVGEHKEEIGEIANKFLDWAESVGKALWPWLEKIGNWAMDHPNLFAGILAGLALSPAIIAGISLLSSFINLISGAITAISTVGRLITIIGGATVSASLLTALGYLITIGSAAYAGYKAASWLIEKAQNYVQMGTNKDFPTDMSGQTLINRLGEKAYSVISKKTPLPDYTPEWENVSYYQKPSNISSTPTPSGVMSENNSWDRRNWFLQWWDSVWG